MPLKYLAGKPEVVTIIGSIHGFLFTVYIITLIFRSNKVEILFRYRFVSGLYKTIKPKNS